MLSSMGTKKQEVNQMRYILVDQVGPHHWRSMYCHIFGKIWHHDITWNLSASEAYASGQRRHEITGYPVYHKTEGKPMRLLTKPA